MTPPKSDVWRVLTRQTSDFVRAGDVEFCLVRVVIAKCSVDYEGRLTAHLPLATRLLMVKADGSVLVHSDGGSYKPLNWMSPPCSMAEAVPDEDEAADGVTLVWVVRHAKSDDALRVRIHEVVSDATYDLGVDPGLVKDGVEAHLQALLAEHIHTLGDGYSLVRREFMTAIGPVDILCRDGDGVTVAVEIKRRGEIDGVEQLTRYLELMNRDPHLAPVTGIFAAQQIKPQARTLAEDRGIRCVVLDYDELKGIDTSEHRLF
ncbi:endonuclease NucS [Nostocoides australiense]